LPPEAGGCACSAAGASVGTGSAGVLLVAGVLSLFSLRRRRVLSVRRQRSR
jgi:hypothetical protein